MSHEAMQNEQFKDYVHPHQLALPGMEEHAHPWAEHVKRGYFLQYHTTDATHQLQAVTPPTEEEKAYAEKWGEEAEPHVQAHLSWASKNPKSSPIPGGGAKYAPGEVEYIRNEDPSSTGAGLGTALFHTAHHFDFGQTTKPIHSPIRTQSGNRFAARTRPDLRPDIWFNMRARGGTGEYQNLEGERTNKFEPTWNLPEDFHPYQQEATAKHRAAAEQARSRPARNQPQLHPRMFR